MEKPILSFRGGTLDGWMCCTWPFGFLEIYSNRIEVTMRTLRRENILGVSVFRLFWPACMTFKYFDVFEKRNRRITFIAWRRDVEAILKTLRDLKYIE